MSRFVGYRCKCGGLPIGQAGTGPGQRRGRALQAVPASAVNASSVTRTMRHSGMTVAPIFV